MRVYENCGFQKGLNFTTVSLLNLRQEEKTVSGADSKLRLRKKGIKLIYSIVNK